MGIYLQCIAKRKYSVLLTTGCGSFVSRIRYFPMQSRLQLSCRPRGVARILECMMHDKYAR